MIRVDKIWLAVEPMDMRARPDTALARVIRDFEQAVPYHAYVFANKRANRIRILVHDRFVFGWLPYSQPKRGSINQSIIGHGKKLPNKHFQIQINQKTK